MIIAIDLETTWLNIQNDKIIEIALVKFDENTFEEVSRYTKLINPWVEIPELIENITWIKNSDVIDSPKFDSIFDEVADFIWDYPILWHNVYFDTWFLESYWIEIKNNIKIDTFLFANSLNLWEKSLNLESLSKSLWIKLEWAHRALNDTLATIKVFEKLVEKLNKFNQKKLKIFKYISSKSSDIFYQYIVDTYIDKNLSIMSIKQFISTYNSLFKKDFVYKEKIVDKSLKLKNIKDILLNISWLEIRNNQLIMLNHIDKAYKESEKVIIEAPTWVWKTFAYLIPSIIHSIRTWEQVYISTTTKALQDQLYCKDLFFLSEKLWIDFVYSKLKWKKNYIWINAFFNFVNDTNFDKDKTSFILKIFYWLFDTTYWELEELDYYGKEFSFLKEVNSDDLITFSSDNEFEDLEFAVRARRQSRKSNIVVINNNILFSDYKWKNNILWKVENLILDEAHNLEDVSTRSLKKTVDINFVYKSFDNIEKTLINIDILVDNYRQLKDEILLDIWATFDLFSEYLYSKVDINSKYKTTLVRSTFYKDKTLKKLNDNLNIKVTEFLSLLLLIPEKSYVKISREINIWEEILDVLSIALSEDKENKYIVIVSDNDLRWTSIEYTYLKPGEYLRDNIWNSLKTCVLTSATLQVSDSFNYIQTMLSLDDFNFLQLESDFDYKKQATLLVPNSLWSIKNNFSDMLKFLNDLFLLIRWNTLVLFTSFAVIKEVYLALNNEMKKNNIDLITQSIWWWKQSLISKFKENSNRSILMWTDSFWEWIDIEDNKLKYLIIYKMPFPVPTDPIFMARSLLFKDSFNDYSIPKSIIKLKQWFWRLIRNKDDKWVVIFLDDRIFSTKWWEKFYDAFPKEMNKKIWDHSKILSILG